MSELNSVDDITMQLYCHSSLEFPHQSSSHALKSRTRRVCPTWSLNVILYGAAAVGNVISQYLSKNRIYLQDPVDCERDVLYRNPHIILKGGEVVVTSSFKTPLTRIEIERFNVRPDLLAELMAEQTPLLEMEPPPSLTTKLFRY
jgi:SWI/SNF-related matrix-associated actin-dependent regulator of chromatin subfamily A3